LNHPKQSLGKWAAFSIALHILVCLGLIYGPQLFPPPPTAKVALVQLVSLEKPRIRVQQPKIQPPEPPVQPPTETQVPTTLPEAPVQNTTQEPKPQKKLPTDTLVPAVSSPAEQAQEPLLQMAELGDPRLSFWIKRVKQKMVSYWNPPGGLPVSGTLEVKVFFVVNRAGKILEPAVQTSSQNRQLDQFALESVQRVETLPPIPPHYKDKDELGVVFTFSYTGQ